MQVLFLRLGLGPRPSFRMFSTALADPLTLTRKCSGTAIPYYTLVWLYFVLNMDSEFECDSVSVMITDQIFYIQINIMNNIGPS